MNPTKLTIKIAPEALGMLATYAAKGIRAEATALRADAARSRALTILDQLDSDVACIARQWKARREIRMILAAGREVLAQEEPEPGQRGRPNGSLL